MDNATAIANDSPNVIPVCCSPFLFRVKNAGKKIRKQLTDTPDRISNVSFWKNGSNNRVIIANTHIMSKVLSDIVRLKKSKIKGENRNNKARICIVGFNPSKAKL